MDFPINRIRGLREASYFNSFNNSINVKGYLPDTRTKEKREDKGFETSINWEDNQNVAKFTIEFKENSKLCYPLGIVRLERNELDRIISNPGTKDMISYEREKLENNEFHGNIVFRGDLPQNMQSMIASTLACYSSRVIQKL